jgi:hypothetical protein
VGGQWAEVKTMVIGEIEPTTPSWECIILCVNGG